LFQINGGSPRACYRGGQPAEEIVMNTRINEGRTDRMLRTVVGIALLAAFFAFPAAGWHWVGLLGIIPLVTGVVGVCPLYMILGITTRP
jgi:hypothetical protein